MLPKSYKKDNFIAPTIIGDREPAGAKVTKLVSCIVEDHGGAMITSKLPNM